MYASESIPTEDEPKQAGVEVGSVHVVQDTLALRTFRDRTGEFTFSDIAIEDPEKLDSEYTLGDLLDRLPGIRMLKLGAMGSFETPDISGRTGNGVRIFVDGLAYPSKDYRGSDLTYVPLTNISEIRIDRGAGRIDLCSRDRFETRPLTQVRVQRGTRALSRTDVVFSERLNKSTNLRLGGFFEGLTDRGRNSGFNQDIYTACAERAMHRGRGRLNGSLLRVQADAGIPRSTAWPAEVFWRAKRHLLRHRGVLRYERLVGNQSMLTLSGWTDIFLQRLRYPEAVNRTDRLLGVSVNGSTFLSNRQLLTIGMEADGAWHKVSEIRYEATAERLQVCDTFQLTPHLRMQALSQLEHSSKHGWIWQGRFRLRHAPRSLLNWELDLYRDARYPTFDEQFQQGYERADTTTVVHLRPEQRIGLRAGCTVKGNTCRVSSHIFLQQGDDWIGPTITEGGLQYRNSSDIQTVGLENALYWRPFEGSVLEACYDWSRCRAADEEPSLHWPEHHASLSFRYSRSYYSNKLEFSGAGDVVYASKSYGATSDGKWVDLSSMAAVHAEIRVRLLDFSAFYGIRNVLDDTAASWYGYPREGRAFRWGVNWNLWN